MARFPKHPHAAFADDIHDCFSRHNELMRAATDARMGVGMLMNAYRNDRITPYPSREELLKRLRVIHDILNSVAPGSPLREAALSPQTQGGE